MEYDSTRGVVTRIALSRAERSPDDARRPIPPLVRARARVRRAVHGRARRRDRERRPAHDPSRSGLLPGRPPVDRERLHADLRRFPPARWPRRRPARASPVFMVGLVLFTLASLSCGLAESDTWLIVARAVQGVGAAIVSPATLSIITD